MEDATVIKGILSLSQSSALSVVLSAVKYCCALHLRAIYRGFAGYQQVLMQNKKPKGEGRS